MQVNGMESLVDGKINAKLGEKGQKLLSNRKYYALAFLFLCVSVYYTSFVWPNTQNVIQSDTVTKPIVQKEVKRPLDTKLIAQQMITFLDEVLNMHLDDFITVERTPIPLRELLKFNNLFILPRLSSIVTLDVFHYVKFNLHRPCTIWSETFQCTKK